MTWFYTALCVLGLALAMWAAVSLPAGTVMYPVRIGDSATFEAHRRLSRDEFIILARGTNRGPYRWMRHPMYVGNIALVTGLGGLAGGVWNALALFTLAEMVHREWAWRERPGKVWP